MLRQRSMPDESQPVGPDARSDPASSDASETPLEILRQRYARGEISKEQFDQMKYDLA
ncbi:MAG: hypothetical protein CL878_09240 [Dehalococcoidia bacterium]|nr:hypothetical protein [Dehalococcoidia bacterium]